MFEEYHFRHFMDNFEVMMDEYDSPNLPGFLHQNVTVEKKPHMGNYRPLKYQQIATTSINWCNFTWPQISADCTEFPASTMPDNPPTPKELIAPSYTEKPETYPVSYRNQVAGPSGLQQIGKQTPPSTSHVQTECPDTNVVIIDDDSDDDVIYVNSGTEIEVNRTSNSDGKPCGQAAAAEPTLRRNPSRKARNSKYGPDDIFFLDNFEIFDSSGSESAPSPETFMSNSQSSPSTSEEKPEDLSVLNLKPWPVDGLHERPEYNSVENRIEKHDYTIRNIQNNAKKNKIQEPKKPKITKKIAPKKYIPRRRNAKRKRSTETDIRVSVQECKEIVNENYELLGVFLKNVNLAKNMGLHDCQGYEDEDSDDGQHDEMCMRDLVRNQCRLFSLINGVPVREALKNFHFFSLNLLVPQ